VLGLGGWFRSLVGLQSYPSWSESCMKSSSDMIAAPAWVLMVLAMEKELCGYLDVRRDEEQQAAKETL